jgi:nitrate reductase NapD
VNISAILVVVKPENLVETTHLLNALPAVEVHHSDQQSGRLIVTQEAASIHDEVAGLKHIKKIPGVVMAEMVQHYFGEDQNNYPADSAAKLDTPDDAACVPSYLNE